MRNYDWPFYRESSRTGKQISRAQIYQEIIKIYTEKKKRLWMNVLKWSYALIWLRSSKRKQIIEILLIRITSISTSLADWNLIWPQNGSCSSVVTPNDRRASFQLIGARQMRPAVGPIDVDGHVRGLTSGQTRIVYCHTSRHDMERIRQRRWQKLERKNLEQLTKKNKRWNHPCFVFTPKVVLRVAL